MESYSYILIGDIGGTNARLELKKISRSNKHSREVIKSGKLESQKYATFDDVIADFLKEFEGTDKWPEVLCLGIAGPVQNNSIKMTNVDWPLVDGAHLEKKFGFKKATFLNDFVANGYGVLNLKESDFVKITDAPVVDGAPKALIGAGTGLGEAFLTRGVGSANYDVFPSEGGHTDLFPRNKLEFDLLQHTLKELNISRCSVERVCAGPAIPMIYEFLKTQEPDLERVLEKEGRSSKDISSEEIFSTALSTKDVLTNKVLELFTGIFGAEAGNLSLKLLPLGGLYLLSGVTAGIKDYLTGNPTFFKNYYAKGRMEEVLKRVPIFLVSTSIANQGAEEFALRFI